MSKSKKIIQFLLMLTTMLACISLYYPSLRSFHTLDTYSNLKNLSNISNIFDSAFWSFVLSGFSGPTGRPVSMFSFALQFDHWPNNLFALKFVNLMIHMFNLVVLFTCLHLLNRVLQLRGSVLVRPFWFALCVAGIWALHPIHVNSVLYLVQRMTLLSGSFVLLSILFFLLAEINWDSKSFWPRFYLFLSLGVLPIMAIFSKENGVLVFFFLGLIKYYISSVANTKLHSNALGIPDAYIKIGVWLPSLCVVGYLTLGYTQWIAGYELREFSLSDRLLTQVRILWRYICLLVLPVPNQFTMLGQDSIEISRSIFSPLTTGLGMLAMVMVGYCLFKLRPKHLDLHLIGVFSMGWYFAGHVLESSSLPLELYYEHRNYIPSIGIIYFIAQFVFLCFSSASNRSRWVIAILVFFGLYVLTVSKMNANLWKDERVMSIISLNEWPKSTRVNQMAIGTLAKHGDYEKALVEIKKSRKRIGYDPKISLFEIEIFCAKNMEFAFSPEWISSFEGKPLRHGLSVGVANLAIAMRQKRCDFLNIDFLHRVIEVLLRGKLEAVERLKILVQLAELYSLQSKFDHSVEEIKRAIKIQPSQPFLYFLAADYSRAAGNLEDALVYIEQGRRKVRFKVLHKDRIDAFDDLEEGIRNMME